MKFTTIIFGLIFLQLSTLMLFAQPPNRRGRDNRDGGRREPNLEWIQSVDANNNKRIELEEYKTAAENFFKKQDKNNNGIFEQDEHPNFKPGMFPPTEPPPFLFLQREEYNLNKADFNEKIIARFNAFDQNKDGALDISELENMRPPRRDRDERRRDDDRQPPPNARFLEAELRFGDRLVKNAPFSAEIIIENTRRLFDGSIITNQTKGAIYRDGAGRTRREQTIDKIGGFSLGDPQKIVLINDFEGRTHYFLDLNRKTFRRQPLGDQRPPKFDNKLQNSTDESLGTKMLEGIKVEGTRTTFEIPVGQIGNDKPIQVVTEKWFSPELQMIVMSRHIDPLAGEQIFRLVNIKLGEPSAEMFNVPKDFKAERE